MSEEQATPKGSPAFEAIKPELIAFLKESLTIHVDVNGYDSKAVEVTVLLDGDLVTWGSACI